jgi:hypothetical protein
MTDTRKLFHRARAAAAGNAPQTVPRPAVEAYVRARQLQREGKTDMAGGTSEYARCHRILRETFGRGRGFWQAHPLDVTPADLDAPAPNRDWDPQGALEIQRELEEASR